MVKTLGPYLRKKRLEKQTAHGRQFSLRHVAARVNVNPSFLSQIERGKQHAPRSLVTKLAEVLGEDPDILLAMDGRISREFQRIITRHPNEFAFLTAVFRRNPAAVVEVLRQVEDGDWSR